MENIYDFIKLNTDNIEMCLTVYKNIVKINTVYMKIKFPYNLIELLSEDNELNRSKFLSEFKKISGKTYYKPKEITFVKDFKDFKKFKDDKNLKMIKLV